MRILSACSRVRCGLACSASASAVRENKTIFPTNCAVLCACQNIFWLRRRDGCLCCQPQSSFVCALTFAKRGPIVRPSVDVVMAVVCIVRPFTLIARALFCRLDYMHSSSSSLLRNGVCSSLKRVMISHQTRSQPTATRMKPGGVHELVLVVVHYAMLDGAGWAAVVVEGARPFPTPRTRSSTHSDQNKLLCNSFAFMCACVP